jgi:hypothetical protein
MRFADPGFARLGNRNPKREGASGITGRETGGHAGKRVRASMVEHIGLCRGPAIASWILQIVAAAILGQTLFFKFTGAEESVFIFATLGAEPWGRIGSGLLELVAVVLLLVPKTAGAGALLALALMSGAILSHLTKLGVEVEGDGGLLFGLAVVVLASSTVVAYLRRHQIPVVGNFF